MTIVDRYNPDHHFHGVVDGADPSDAVQGDMWIRGDLDPAELRMLDGGQVSVLATSGSGGGTTDHGGLTGLGDDDHPQYLLHTEADATYEPIITVLGPSRGGIGSAALDATANALLVFDGSNGVEFTASPAGPDLVPVFNGTDWTFSTKGATVPTPVNPGEMLISAGGVWTTQAYNPIDRLQSLVDISYVDTQVNDLLVITDNTPPRSFGWRGLTDLDIAQMTWVTANFATDDHSHNLSDLDGNLTAAKGGIGNAALDAGVDALLVFTGSAGVGYTIAPGDNVIPKHLTSQGWVFVTMPTGVPTDGQANEILRWYNGGPEWVSPGTVYAQTLTNLTDVTIITPAVGSILAMSAVGPNAYQIDSPTNLGIATESWVGGKYVPFYRGVASDFIRIAGGSDVSSGGRIVLYGESHSNASEIRFYQDTVEGMRFDDTRMTLWRDILLGTGYGLTLNGGDIDLATGYRLVFDKDTSRAYITDGGSTAGRHVYVYAYGGLMVDFDGFLNEIQFAEDVTVAGTIDATGAITAPTFYTS